MVTMAEPDAVLRDVRALAPLLREHAAECEARRTMPRHLVDACAAAGLFTLALPRALGGLECDPLTTIRVIEELSWADASGAWTVMIGNTTAFTAWLEPDVAREILSTCPNAPMAGLLMPAGTAVPDGTGAFTVSGRWPFNSGAPHAAWFCSGIMVMDGGAPRMVAGRQDWRFAFFPASDVTIIDTWHAAGLKGTGSHDISVSNIRVPERYTAAPLFERSRHEGPLSRLTLWSVLTMLLAGLPLGIARRALDEFNALSQKKSRAADGARLADDSAIQVDVARAEADVQAARAFVFEAFGEAWVALQSGRDNTLAERTRMTTAMVQAMRLCVAAVDVVFSRAGGGALYESSPLQRCFRDIHAAGQHIAFSHETWKRAGKSVLGIEQPTMFL